MKKIILITSLCAIYIQAQCQSWNLTGNSGTNVSTNFIGTTDNIGLKIRTNNAVRITVTSSGKVGIGITSPAFKLDVKGGSINTDSVYRIKGNAVLSASIFNTFIGVKSGYYTTSGSSNTAIGYAALYANTTGSGNIAVGENSLFNNTIGVANCAFGVTVLYNNNTGSRNTAMGTLAFTYNNTGNDNTGIGYQTLYFNTSGQRNTAIGDAALYSHTTGEQNTAAGYNALYYATSGILNTGLGSNSGCNNGALINNSTAIGAGAGHVFSLSNYVEIGDVSVVWIGGQVGWSTYSDRRIKDNIRENVPGLSFITRLRPVTYNLNIHRQNEMINEGKTGSGNWPEKYDIEKETMSGFIAQEVEMAAKEANYNFNGVTIPKQESGLYSLRYEEFVVPLVKAVQELSEQNNELKNEMQSLKDNFDRLSQKVSTASGNNYFNGFLGQNTPNPFSKSTNIPFILPVKFTEATIKITNSQTGQTLAQYQLKQNQTSQEVNLNLSNGIYSYALIIDGVTVDTKQFVNLK